MLFISGQVTKIENILTLIISWDCQVCEVAKDVNICDM